MSNIYEGKQELTAMLSSNMINTLLWVIDDSHILELNVTNSDLGPSPPILLNTTNLSILLPGITKWHNKCNFTFYFRGCFIGGTIKHFFLLIFKKRKTFCCAQSVSEICCQCHRRQLNFRCAWLYKGTEVCGWMWPQHHIAFHSCFVYWIRTIAEGFDSFCWDIKIVSDKFRIRHRFGRHKDNPEHFDRFIQTSR